jgi:hypothetical protein
MGQEQSSGHSRNKASDISPVGDIVVVKSGKTTTKDQQIVRDPDIVKLNNITTFSPLMKAPLNSNSATDFEITNRLYSRPARAMCARYETHLKLCAEAVAFDQDAITRRLKEIDNYSASVLRGVSERHKKLQGQMHFISTVEDVKRNIDRIEMTLQQIIPLMEKLNEMLPEQDRMEPFLKM